jgi:hypothetical protein
MLNSETWAGKRKKKEEEEEMLISSEMALSWTNKN